MNKAASKEPPLPSPRGVSGAPSRLRHHPIRHAKAAGLRRGGGGGHDLTRLLCAPGTLRLFRLWLKISCCCYDTSREEMPAQWPGRSSGWEAEGRTHGPECSGAAGLPVGPPGPGRQDLLTCLGPQARGGDVRAQKASTAWKPTLPRPRSKKTCFQYKLHALGAHILSLCIQPSVPQLGSIQRK